MPLLSACRPSVGTARNPLRAEEVNVAVISFNGSLGEVTATNKMEMKGNTSSLGFPARKESTPGVSSKENGARTRMPQYRSRNHVSYHRLSHGPSGQDGGTLTWGKFEITRDLGEETSVTLRKEALNLWRFLLIHSAVHIRRGSP